MLNAILAQAAAAPPAVAPQVGEVSTLVNTIAQLGPTAGAIIVVVLMLRHQENRDSIAAQNGRDEAEKMRAFLQALKDDFKSELRNLWELQRQSQQQFQNQVTRITGTQTEVIKEMTTAFATLRSSFDMLKDAFSDMQSQFKEFRRPPETRSLTDGRDKPA